MRLEDRIEQIRQDISSERYTVAAKESAAVIEFAFREIYRRSIGEVAGPARQKAFEAENKIGGPGKDVGSFTLGELVNLFREAKLFQAYSEASGIQLRAITMIDFNQVVALRNRLQHGMEEATRGEAQLFLQCVENMLEAFGILSLDAAASTADSTDGIERPDESLRRARPEPPRASTYSPHESGELSRLDDQGVVTRDFDLDLMKSAIGSGTKYVGLDVGCAQGIVTNDRFGAYADSFAKIIAIDKDENCIAEGAARYPEYEFRCLNVEDVGAADELRSLLASSSDGNELPVIASLFVVLHHVAAPIRILKLLRTVLPRGSRVIIRTIDEGSIMGFPDTDGRIERVVRVGEEFPDGTDRHHGRKLQFQMFRAGFRDIRTFIQPYILSSFEPSERDRFFRVEFGFRQSLCDRAVRGQGFPDDGASIRHQLASDLDEIEMDFQDPAFAYSMSWYGAIAAL
jgi:2-polyprenyl-3-methyl-5-hydroxy-6-metoxy-1,4-benzoquinol methylase